MNRLSLIGLLSLIFGCGGAAKSYETAYGTPPPEPEAEMEAGYAGEEAYAEAPPAPVMASESEVATYASYDEVPRKARIEIPEPAPTRGAAQPTLPQESGSDGVSDRNVEQPTVHEDSLVIYSGYLQLRVKRLLDAVDRITKMVEERGGYIDSLTRTAVVVRIPGKDFEEAMSALAAVGDLMDRWVRAEDVTDQFTDLKGRLAVAEEARERLLKLLEKVSNVSERLRILQEIKRLSEMIDTIDSSLAAIRNLVDYFTITIDLVPVLAVERMDTGLSPFGWIRALRPHVQSLWDGRGNITMKLPSGFVLFDEEDTFRAQAADTSVIRAATTDNEPLGDNKFWADAVDFEMTTRQEKIIEAGNSGKLAYRVYENDDVTPRFYLVALMTVADKICVIEVFYPNQEAFDRHHGSVLEALATVEVK